MRLALAVAAALAVAGCSVDTEGAACTEPGGTAECPAGQACGTGLRCSGRAAGCAPCPGGTRQCLEGAVKECSAALDAACGTWETVAGKDCAARGLRCEAAAAPTCACDPHAADAELVVDAGAAGDPTDPVPNGNAEPAACRFRSLGAGLAAAAARGPGAVVRLAGDPVAYGPATGDAAPFVVPAGVTLASSEPAPLEPIRTLLVAGEAPDGVRLEAGATLAGIVVAAAGAPGAVGIRVTCAAGDPVLLDRVQVERGPAGTPFATGIRVEGECEVAVTDAAITGASGTGLDVERAGPTAKVTVDRAVLDGNGVGVRLARGDLTLRQTAVRRSLGVGVDATGATTGRAALTVLDGTLHLNGDTALLASQLDRLDVQGTRFCENAAVTERGAASPRTVGGFYGSGSPPAALTFKRNRLHGNAGDQAMVASATATWVLNGAADRAACEADANVFGGYDADGGVGLSANGANVNALWNSWASGEPNASDDYRVITPGALEVGTETGRSDFCLVPIAAGLECPAPPPPP